MRTGRGRRKCQSEIEERRQRRIASKHLYVEVLEEEPNRNWTKKLNGEEVKSN
jgi:hypothetical protein